LGVELVEEGWYEGASEEKGEKQGAGAIGASDTAKKRHKPYFLRAKRSSTVYASFRDYATFFSRPPLAAPVYASTSTL
jgi:hypothetical protein